MWKKYLSLLSIILLCTTSAIAQEPHSVARQWNEALLQAIRNDFARPTVHARNLFHTSIAMYDAWAFYDDVADTYLSLSGIDPPSDLFAAREEAISYAAYRLLTHRFKRSPRAPTSLARFGNLMDDLGYDTAITSTDYVTGSPAALGNHIAQCLIEFGLQDGANEQNDYGNLHYQPVNPPLLPDLPGNPDIIDPNRWQPLSLETFIDQSGNIRPSATPEFQSPEWGEVTPFALSYADRTIYDRDGFGYWVYQDPGPPPFIDTTSVGGLSEAYKWGFMLVSVWSAHLDVRDSVMWDISPASIGNIPELPETTEGYQDFFNLLDGGDPGIGHTVNPHTGQPYQPQIVPRGDYARVLAEFWADGPDSETPPGHWYTILNWVNDHPDFEKRFRGTGSIIDDLEWDVKAYLALGGAVHDAAIAAWGVKGWYDYIRPISAIRSMADRGQGSDPNLPGYHPGGIPLLQGFVEIVAADDSLAGEQGENIGKIKLYAWRGHDYVEEPETDVAGVGWILADNWWPYQRPSFVTPPFAGYVSGHSTFSRAAAEVMTLLTGDPYFPGGMGEFLCEKNEFLVFEDGPSVDLTLQWATYRDASDQTSLSRIWGGIHPPADDIPGRLMGEEIGVNAFLHAERYFTGQIKTAEQTSETASTATIYPNPVSRGMLLRVELNLPPSDVAIRLYNIRGQVVHTQTVSGVTQLQRTIIVDTNTMASGLYLLRITGNNLESSHRVVLIR